VVVELVLQLIVIVVDHLPVELVVQAVVVMVALVLVVKVVMVVLIQVAVAVVQAHFKMWQVVQVVQELLLLDTLEQHKKALAVQL
jgi:hypothetical protein